MANDNAELTYLQQQQRTRQQIEKGITRDFAPEDDGLRNALDSARAAGLPEIQISPIQGKLLQVLAAACNAHKILEIGALGGYSGIWLARSLPAGGRMITLEISPEHAAIVRNAFEKAGVSDRTEVRVGRALELAATPGKRSPFRPGFY